MAAKKKDNQCTEKWNELVAQHQQLSLMTLDPDVDMEMVLDSLESVEGAMEAKANAYGYVYKNMEAEKEACKAKSAMYKAWAKDIDAHIKAIENNEDKLKLRMMEGMIATGLDEKGIHTDLFDITVKGNGGVEPLIIDKEDEVPQEFMKVVLERDNDKIREFLADHDCDWAHLAPRGKRLEIK